MLFGLVRQGDLGEKPLIQLGTGSCRATLSYDGAAGVVVVQRHRATGLLDWQLSCKVVVRRVCPNPPYPRVGAMSGPPCTNEGPADILGMTDFHSDNLCFCDLLDSQISHIPRFQDFHIPRYPWLKLAFGL